MSSELGKSSGAIQSAEADLAKLNSELNFQLAQAAVDIAGIADPTPVSDIVGAGMSLYSGDVVGAALSLVSIVPYAGDALGKSAKGARVAKKINDLKKRVAAAISATNLAKKTARIKAAAAVRAKRKAEAAKKAADACTTSKCPAPSNPFGTRLPKDGTWPSGQKGSGPWIPDPNTPRGREILEATGGKPINFEDGYPDFSPYATHSVDIPMSGGSADFDLANKAAGLETTPPGMTWHHHQNGTTMELVPSAINNNVPHTGGASIVGSTEF